MKKIFRIVIIIFLFIVCLLLGANFGSFTLPGNNLQSNLESKVETQVQILLFEIDNFDNRKPQLKSIWSINLYWQDVKGIMLVPLAEQSDPEFNEFKKSFILTPEKELSTRTLKYFNSKFKTKWNATIILDEVAKQKLLIWLAGGHMENIPNSEPDVMVNQNILCMLLSNNVPSLNNFDWETVYPSHFKSNLSTDVMHQIWSNFIGTATLNCELIQN